MVGEMGATLAVTLEAVAAEEEEADTTVMERIPASTGTTSPTLKGSSAAA